MANEGKTINRLSGVETHKLNRWVEDNIASFAPGITKQEVANGATIALKFMVTWGNVDGALRACDLKLPSKPQDVPQAEKIAALAKALRELAEATGGMYPKVVEDILREVGL